MLLYRTHQVYLRHVHTFSAAAEKQDDENIECVRKGYNRKDRISLLQKRKKEVTHGKKKGESCRVKRDEESTIHRWPGTKAGPSFISGVCLRGDGWSNQQRPWGTRTFNGESDGGGGTRDTPPPQTNLSISSPVPFCCQAGMTGGCSEWGWNSMTASSRSSFSQRDVRRFLATRLQMKRKSRRRSRLVCSSCVRVFI